MMQHMLFILSEGIYQYRQHKGSIADKFDWDAINRHVTLFYSPENGCLNSFPQVEGVLHILDTTFV